MIKGMTGYGNAEVSSAGIRAIVEIRSVNHRYLDVSYYLPIGFAVMEDKIKSLLGKDVKRGKIAVSLKIVQKPGQSVDLNKDNVQRYLRYAKSMKKDFGLKDDLTVADIIKLPGVVETKETFVSAVELWGQTEKGIKKALRGLVAMRKREGRTLAADVSDQLRRMKAQVRTIQARSKAILKEKKNALSPEEFSSAQKSCDINEEMTRLAHYIDEVKALLKSATPVGKKIDFIAQEMQRETNTTGSKLLDKTVSNAVIALKSKIEKIREQAQNIE